MAETIHKLLVVEDEKNVGLTLIERLRRENFDVTWATTAIEARQAIEKNSFHLALMDVGLPDGSGFDVASFLRSKQPGTAIIFLTAFGNPEDRVRGLELGAEDYVVKPFHLKELILRVQNGLKRAKYINTPLSPGEDSVKIGKATIHFSKFEAEVDGTSVSLTHKETALLKLLVEKKGKVVSRDEILAKSGVPRPKATRIFRVRERWITLLFDSEGLSKSTILRLSKACAAWGTNFYELISENHS
jgi:DNA-binding response OmpR family regulator